MVDIDKVAGPAGAKKNEPDDRFEFFIAQYKAHCEPLLEEGAKWLAYKSVYDTQRPVLLNDAHVASATELAKAIGELVTGKDAKFLVEFRKDSKGLEDTVTRLKAIRDSYMAPLVKFNQELRDRINAYQVRQRAAQQKKIEDDRKAAAALAAKGTPEAIQKAAEMLEAPQERAGTVRSDHGSTAGFAVTWTIKSIDSALLPVEFKSPDEAKIKARLKTMTDAEKKTPGFIPGCVFEEKLQTRLS